MNYPIPQSVTGLNYFSGMVDYFCTHITHSVDLPKCNPKRFTKMPEAEASYITSKQNLSNLTKLSHFDTSSRTQMFFHHVCLPHVAIGIVLQQIVNSCGCGVSHHMHDRVRRNWNRCGLLDIFQEYDRPKLSS